MESNSKCSRSSKQCWKKTRTRRATSRRRGRCTVCLTEDLDVHEKREKDSARRFLEQMERTSKRETTMTAGTGDQGVNKESSPDKSTEVWHDLENHTVFGCRRKVQVEDVYDK